MRWRDQTERRIPLRESGRCPKLIGRLIGWFVRPLPDGAGCSQTSGGVDPVARSAAMAIILMRGPGFVLGSKPDPPGTGNFDRLANRSRGISQPGSRNG
jgi:hypothetical protein